MVKVENVAVKFGDKVVFNGYSNNFEDNKLYCILGKSGCGKSTLLRIMAGLLIPDSGKVFLNGEEINKPSNQIFMMHQRYTNFPWINCFNNVLLPMKIKGKITGEHKVKAMELLDKVGLVDYAKKFPYELSGGMQQRLALARTLMVEPPVILMDEPLSALDPKTRSAMQDLLLDLHYKTKNLMVMVTHDPDEAKKMNDVIINL